MTTAIMMAGSSLGEHQKPQMKIDVEGTTHIVAPLTESLNLTCSLVPAAASDPKDKKADFKTITGVYIDLKKAGSDDEEADVAKMTISSPGNATLSGLLPRATIIEFDLSKGFIKVGVAEPDINHAGTYTCKVAGLNAADDPVTLTTHKTSVQHMTPEMGDIIEHIHGMKKEIQQQSTKLQQQSTKLADMEERFGHVETGTLSFYRPSNSFSASDTYRYNKLAAGRSYNMRYKDTTVAFSKPYTTPPSITWSVGFLYDGRTYLMYSVDLMSVSTKSFTLRVGVYHSAITDYMFDDLVLQWTSIPK